MRAQILILTAILLGLTFYVSPAQAETRREEAMDRLEERQTTIIQLREDKRDDRVQRRCDLVNAQIDRRITFFNARKDDILARQKRIAEHLTAFVDRLEEMGYDVSEVRNDLEMLQQMIAASDGDYAAFIEKLEATKEFDCEDPDGAFVAAVREAREALETYRASVKENRTFIRETIRPDIQALREQDVPTNE
jgi:hypothetical protein